MCSAHFRAEDFVQGCDIRRLKPDAVPSVFHWKPLKTRKPPAERSAPDVESDTETDSASETEIAVSEDSKLMSRKIQVDRNDPVPCSHKFSLAQLLELSKANKKIFRHYTGFESKKFEDLLTFLVPDKDRKHIKYYDERAKSATIDMSLLFDEDFEDEPIPSRPIQPRNTHAFSVENEFLLVLMKLRMGLTNLDLSARFGCSDATISRILTTWINFIYLRLGSLVIWPHRDVIIAKMPPDFRHEYPRTMIIIDCLELNVQMPSSRQMQSKTYSDYKSTNTFKCLVGVDALGGIMFVSQLYTGRISDKEICHRSGFFNLLQEKLNTDELLPGDAVMADKGFLIKQELEDMGLQLNIPPFLKDKPRFSVFENIQTHTIAHHRIHVERAIAKVRKFSIFEKRINIRSAGQMNQIWTACCLLSNFQDPIL